MSSPATLSPSGSHHKIYHHRSSSAQESPTKRRATEEHLQRGVQSAAAQSSTELDIEGLDAALEDILAGRRQTTFRGKKSPEFKTMHSKPSRMEAFGLVPGCLGRLISRTSTWKYKEVRELEDPAWIEDRTYRLIGADKDTQGLRMAWTKDLERAIQEALGVEGIAWIRFYPLRVGTERYGFPVTLLVDIPAAFEPSWEEALSAALACRSVLVHAGIKDVEVELRIIDTTPHNETTPLDLTESTPVDTQDVTALQRLRVLCQELDSLGDGGILGPYITVSELNRRYITNIGCGIRAQDTTKTGTLGLLLQSDDQQVTYGLTCAHAIKFKSGEPRQDFDAKRQDTIVNALPRSCDDDIETLETHIADIEKAVKSCEDEIEKVMPVWVTLSEQEDEDLDSRDLLRKNNVAKILERQQKDLADFQSRLKKSQEVLVCLKDLQTENLSKPLGTVAYRTNLGVSSTGFSRDWALIRMNPEGTRPKPDNTVSITKADKKDLDRFLAAERELYNLFSENHGCIIKQEPGLKTPGMRETLWKMGQRTGFTIGRANEIEAVVRTFEDSGESKVAWELIVLSEHTDIYPCFSKKGDSGAAVCNTSGQVIGILSTGLKLDPEKMKPWQFGVKQGEGDLPAMESLGEREASADLVPTRPGTDISFVIPIAELLGDIERTTGKKFRIA